MKARFSGPRIAWLAALLPLGLVSCTPKETQVLLGPSQALGTVLAEEAARAAGANKQVALILPDSNWGPASTVEEALKAALKKRGLTTVVAKSANLGDPMRRGQVGLKSADFLEGLQQAAGAGAVVSLAGAPLLNPGDAARISPEHPPLLVVATGMLGNLPGLPADSRRLAALLDAKVIQLAIIDGGSASAAPPPGQTDAIHQLFAQNYLILRSPN